MVVYYPNGQPFILLSDARRLREQAEKRVRYAKERARREQHEREQAEESTRTAESQLARLAAQLQVMGIDPET